LESGDYDGITSRYEYQKSLINGLGSPEMLFLIGEAYRSLHYYHAACFLFQEAKKYYSEIPPKLLLGLGKSLLGIYDKDAAYAVFTELAEKHASYKDFPIACYHLGQILLNAKNYNAAEARLKAALAGLHPDLPMPQVLTGIAYSLSGQDKHEESIPFFKRAVDILARQGVSEELYDLYIELGEQEIMIQDFGHAAETFKAALKIAKGLKQPAEQEPVMFRLADCYQRIGQENNAMEMLKRIVEGHNSIWEKVASARINEMEIYKAVDSFKKAQL
ncbi:MAG: tetratricopeptide repeat protein, partial [Pseudomonadota bacterium]